MRIVRIRMRNFRCIKNAEIYPTIHNVFLGPNNSGKTAILEGLNLVLNPEITYRSHAIDENDFYQRRYKLQDNENPKKDRNPERPLANENTQIGDSTTDDANVENDDVPNVYIEVVLSDLTTEDENYFRDTLVPWRPQTQDIIESANEGEDPFENAETAIRVFFEGWYDSSEDDFFYNTYFLRKEGDDRDDCPKFSREHKRYIGFLIYRDFRALTRPITLEPVTLFGRLVQSQLITLKHFEDVFQSTKNALISVTADPEFASLLIAYKAEIERFLFLSESDPSVLSFFLTDRTREQVKSSAQLHVRDEIDLPLQNMGAGTRSLAILAVLTLIMRRRGRGILALEEPETFLFPHAQRRVIDECLQLADQIFVTTHSPYILERIPVEGVGRIARKPDGEVTWTRISTSSIKQVNLYSKRLRQVHCEALVGHGVLVVEGDSDRWWLVGASRILNRNEWNGRRQEALELLGISIVSADTNGDILKLGAFFTEAGLRVIGLFDNITDSGLMQQIVDSPFPSLLLRQNGLEDLLVAQLPIDILRRFLTEAPHCKDTLINKADAATMTEDAIRSETRVRLIGNKGSASMHDWLISLLDVTNIPPTLADIVDIVSAHISGSSVIQTCCLTK